MFTGMVINTNISSINTQRQLTKSNNSLETSTQRLASGMRVNSAKDDAAGLAIANKMTSQIGGMTVAIRNANDGISLIQTAESALGEMIGTYQRMRDLAIQSLNDGAVTDSDRSKMEDEFYQLEKELSRILNNTEFNGKKILAGDLAGGKPIQVGPNTTSDNVIPISIEDLRANGFMSHSLGDSASGIDHIDTYTNTVHILPHIETAMEVVNSVRSKLGATQNRITSAISNLQSSHENQSAARSRIMDADFAVETAALSRNQILKQAGTAMLSQANIQPQAVMSLLQ